MRDLGSGLDFSGDDRPGFDAGLDELARTDLLLDALAERADLDFGDAEDSMDEALAALMGQWRDDLRWPPASALVAPEEAVEALRTGIEERRRARHGLAAVGSVAASLLVLSGFGAVVAEARPGDALYGLHAMFFDQRRVNEDHIVLSAKADMAKVQQMIDQGQWTQAQNQLAEISSTVQSMNNDGRRQDLINQLNLLNTRVESRDPNATLPPAAPPTGVVSQAPQLPRAPQVPQVSQAPQVPQAPPSQQPKAPRTKPSAPAASTPSEPSPTTATTTTTPPPPSSPSASASTPQPTPTSTKHHHHDKSSATPEPTP